MELFGMDDERRAHALIRKAEREVTLRGRRLAMRGICTGAACGAATALCYWFEVPTRREWALLMFASFTCAFFFSWRDRLAAKQVLRKLLRSQPELCANCGYDLHASQGPRCPECGSVFAPTAEKEEAV